MGFKWYLTVPGTKQGSEPLAACCPTRILATSTGFEPATSAVTGRRTTWACSEAMLCAAARGPRSRRPADRGFLGRRLSSARACEGPAVCTQVLCPSGQLHLGGVAAHGQPWVEPRGLEPRTPCLQSRCATNCAMAPQRVLGPSRSRTRKNRAETFTRLPALTGPPHTAAVPSVPPDQRHALDPGRNLPAVTPRTMGARSSCHAPRQVRTLI